MTIKILFSIIIICVSGVLLGQNTFSTSVYDSATHSPIIGAKVQIKGMHNSAKTDAMGSAVLVDIPNGKHTIEISHTGFESVHFILQFPLDQRMPLNVYLVPEGEQLDEIVIEATRANRTVANLPTRIEVLTEEIDEAASMEPSKIAHLITHSTGIQVQTTSATSNGAVVRIQGLNGRYTQMLKDGFPLYGGFSGSLDVLQIAPLDLRQVEYIKGSASTLYGGGAIGGLINLLSKKPVKDESLLHINYSHIGAKDYNAFVSRRFGKFGFTNLASLHLHSPYDADNDGYSDIPEVSKFNFNPRLFYYPDRKTEIYLGAAITKETRFGGDMDLINRAIPDSSHFYFDNQNSSRITTQFQAKRTLSAKGTLTLRNSVSAFDRFIQIRENVMGKNTRFSGRQLNSFSELNYNLNQSLHNLNVGFNVYTDRFSENKTDTDSLRNQEYTTYGFFINHLWDISKKLIVESGLRIDYAMAESNYSRNDGEAFVLPRISALYKLSKKFSTRLGGGLGYRMPTIFNEEAEPYGYKKIQPINFDSLKAERSYGGNFDFKYQSNFGSQFVLFTFNQMFFYNLIVNPILLNADQSGKLFYASNQDFLHSRGFESQIKLTVNWFTWFFGYTYTDAFLQRGGSETRLVLTPQHSIKGDLLFVLENKWRIGWDYEYKSQQILSTGLRSRSLFSTGIVVERTLDRFVIFLNAENFTDTRQTRYERLTSGPNGTPQFTDIWAPLDGYFFNGGIKIRL